MSRTTTTLALLAALLPPAGGILAQEPAAGTRIPVDSAVRTGTLPNGLRYYVRQNGQPKARAELRLVVNAGSVLEDEKQLALQCQDDALAETPHCLHAPPFDGCDGWLGCAQQERAQQLQPDQGLADDSLAQLLLIDDDVRQLRHRLDPVGQVPFNRRAWLVGGPSPSARS